MDKPANAEHPIHDLIRDRWSPRAFTNRPIPPADLCSLFEAARWSASAYNDQPWYFIIATRDEPTEHDKMLTCLVEANQAWAKQAPVLAIAVARTSFDHNQAPNRHAYYDTGQAVAALSYQATALGIRVHQMGGFKTEKVVESYGVPKDHEPVVAIAIGYPGRPSQLPDELWKTEMEDRRRRPIEETVFQGHWALESPALKLV
jgi:nitroreductase